MRSLLLFLSFLTLYSCAKPSGNLKLSVSRNFVFGGSSLAADSGGGLMVWGTNNAGDSFARTIDNSDELTLNLNFGKWDFYIMAWKGNRLYNGSPNASNDTPFGGDILCGKKIGVDVSSSQAALDLGISFANCSDPVFKGPGTMVGSQLPNLQIKFCDSNAGVTSGSDNCSDDLSLTTVGRRAPVGSYRVSFRNQVTVGGNRNLMSGGIATACIPMVGAANAMNDGLSSVTIPNLPAGNSKTPFDVSVELFFGDNACDTVNPKGVSVVTIPKGAAQNDNSKYFNTNAGQTNLQVMSIPGSFVCSGRGAGEFAGGDGTTAYPYIICNVLQWHKMNQAGKLANHYKLQANLNFNPYTKAIAAVQFPNSDCVDPSNNFFPIGFLIPSCPNGGPIIWGTASPFTGSLRGAGFALQNFRIRAEQEDYVGLFGKLGNSASIRDLNLSNGEVNGRTYVGAIAGEATGSSLELRKIRVKNLRVSGRENSVVSYTGGLIGSVANMTIGSIIVKKKAPFVICTP